MNNSAIALLAPVHSAVAAGGVLFRLPLNLATRSPSAFLFSITDRQQIDFGIHKLMSPTGHAIIGANQHLPRQEPLPPLLHPDERKLAFYSLPVESNAYPRGFKYQLPDTCIPRCTAEGALTQGAVVPTPRLAMRDSTSVGRMTGGLWAPGVT